MLVNLPLSFKVFEFIVRTYLSIIYGSSLKMEVFPQLALNPSKVLAILQRSTKGSIRVSAVANLGKSSSSPI